mmetsp:Transcript_32558/g.74393  ORF Transcript_32558/g.74393 Transcript_32558/m.74393 type:complete len:113 (+) Transcript_32558:62-400(+)
MVNLPMTRSRYSRALLRSLLSQLGRLGCLRRWVVSQSLPDPPKDAFGSIGDGRGIAKATLPLSRSLGKGAMSHRDELLWATSRRQEWLDVKCSFHGYGIRATVPCVKNSAAG